MNKELLKRAKIACSHIKMEKRHCVYGLVCPIEKTLKYVGCSTNPSLRYREHILCAVLSGAWDDEKSKWICGLLGKQMMPEIIIIAQTDDKKQAGQLEALLLKIDFNLTNKSKHGNYHTLNFKPINK